MKLSYSILDVFTTTPLQGNPLAVVNVPRSLKVALTEAQKQAIAAEFNLSETVFLHEVSPEDTLAEYDIFTIKAHIAFAGHPTIGTAIYIKTHAQDHFSQITTLNTIAGQIPISFNPTTSQAAVQVPHNIHIHSQTPVHPFPESSTNPTNPPLIPIVSIVKGMSFFLVPISTLENLQPFTKGILAPEQVYQSPYLDSHESWNRGLNSTFFYVDITPPDQQPRPNFRRFRTRGFGLREDPGTGSASCALCAYSALQEPRERGAGPFEFHLTQGVEMGRPCDIYVTVTRSEDGERIEDVRLSGTAVMVMRGEIDI